MDSHYITWTFETPSIRSVHAVTLEYLTTIPISPRTSPTMLIHSFNLLLSYLCNQTFTMSDEPADAAAGAALHPIDELFDILSPSAQLEDLRR